MPHAKGKSCKALGDPAQREARLQLMPLGRIGTAEDIAYGVLYLASDETALVTG